MGFLDFLVFVRGGKSWKKITIDSEENYLYRIWIWQTAFAPLNGKEPHLTQGEQLNSIKQAKMIILFWTKNNFRKESQSNHVQQTKKPKNKVWNGKN